MHRCNLEEIYCIWYLTYFIYHVWHIWAGRSGEPSTETIPRRNKTYVRYMNINFFVGTEFLTSSINLMTIVLNVYCWWYDLCNWPHFKTYHSSIIFEHFLTEPVWERQFQFWETLRGECLAIWQKRAAALWHVLTVLALGQFLPAVGKSTSKMETPKKLISYISEVSSKKWLF